jgi:hypothetical protein
VRTQRMLSIPPRSDDCSRTAAALSSWRASVAA